MKTERNWLRNVTTYEELIAARDVAWETACVAWKAAREGIYWEYGRWENPWGNVWEAACAIGEIIKIVIRLSLVERSE